MFAHGLFIQNQNQYPYIPIRPKLVLDHIGWFCLMEKLNLLWERRISRRKLSIQPVISLSMWISSPIRHYDTDRLPEDNNNFFHDIISFRMYFIWMWIFSSIRLSCFSCLVLFLGILSFVISFWSLQIFSSIRHGAREELPEQLESFDKLEVYG